MNLKSQTIIAAICGSLFGAFIAIALAAPPAAKPFVWPKEGCPCEYRREPIDCRQLSAEAERSKDFAMAVSGNSMGWFCENYGYGDIELAAKDQMDLYRKVAAKVAYTKAPPLKPMMPWSNVPEENAKAPRGWNGKWPYKGFWFDANPTWWKGKSIPQAEKIQ